MDEGVIRNARVEYDRQAGTTAVDYDADLPQGQVREMLKEKAKGSEA